MQLRISRIKRNDRTYEYAQLVESFRRESDGMPTHRVVATLGALSPLEIENWRTTLQAAREHKRVVVASSTASRRPLPRPAANLRYLDVAVVLELWRQTGLGGLLEDLLPTGAAQVAPASIVAALAIQRCVDPGSKLYATRWFPKTALPELLGIAPELFNNTRVHRVLDDLDAAGSSIMARLPRHLCETDGAFVSLFLDVTDTWFVGQGPELAEVGKTKEGLIQQKIGIVLLCNEKGYPLRWEVIGGREADCTAMTGMLKSIAGLGWVGEAPVVVDRAMGHTAQILQMAEAGLRFVTALTVSEIGTYAERLPFQALAELSPRASDDPEQRVRDEAQAAAAAQAAGMQQVEDNLLVIDLGLIERQVEDPSRSEPAAGATPALAMQIARQIGEQLANGRFSSRAAAARAAGMSDALAKKYDRLRRLPEDVQREVAEDQSAGYAIAHLLEIARLDEPEAQREAFRALRARSIPKPPIDKPVAAESQPQPTDQACRSLKVRVSGYFNPQRFVDQRLRAQRHVEEVQAFVAELNAALERPTSRRTREAVAAAIDRKLRGLDLLEAFRVVITEQDLAGRRCYRVEVALDEQEWAARRRYDGFTVLVAHPSLPQGPVELAQLYRAKDVVEKDFQGIKSLIELRPVRHRTDGKVRAHVTICMLSLRLERALEHALKGRYTAGVALELLEDCRLNRYAAQEGASAAYVLTEPTSEQQKMLRALGLRTLVDQDEVLDRLTPR